MDSDRRNFGRRIFFVVFALAFFLTACVAAPLELQVAPTIVGVFPGSNTANYFFSGTAAQLTIKTNSAGVIGYPVDSTNLNLLFVTLNTNAQPFNATNGQLIIDATPLSNGSFQASLPLTNNAVTSAPSNPPVIFQ